MTELNENEGLAEKRQRTDCGTTRRIVSMNTKTVSICKAQTTLLPCTAALNIGLSNIHIRKRGVCIPLSCVLLRSR
jgi:hypothetical protein